MARIGTLLRNKINTANKAKPKKGFVILTEKIKWGVYRGKTEERVGDAELNPRHQTVRSET